MQQSNQSQSIKNPEFQEGRWTQQEHICFLRGITKYGKDWKTIENLVKSRLCSQVRSHAQKFFLKLNKISKDRKKAKNKEAYLPTEIQKEILLHITPDNITENTPMEISYVLEHDWSVPQNLPVPKKRPPKAKHVTQLKKLNVSNNQQIISNNVQIQSPKHEESLDNCENQSSFFMHLIKMRKQHFTTGHEFKNLFNFGTKDQGIPQQIQTNLIHSGFQVYQPKPQCPSIRKRSFGLLNSQDDDQKLKETLNNLHKALGLEK